MDTLVYCAHEYTQANLDFALAVEPENLALQQRILDVRATRANNQPTVPSRLQDELATNPFLRYDATAVINAAEKQSQQSCTDHNQVFSAIRHWKDHF